MPYIKYKAFALDQALCYKCGKLIEKGQFNWSYNTRRAGMFSHANCLLSEEEFQSSISKPVETPDQAQIEVEAPTEEKASYQDITDLIRTENKHKQTELIRSYLKMREYPFLYGAPGAGKTHLAVTLASDMGLDCVVISMSLDMFKSEILGSVSPVSGNYFATMFYHIWKKGGVILFDEVGLASGAFLNVLNAALAQKELRFPNGDRIPMHSNCFIIFADNSALYGNDPIFPERQDAGSAFRDRLTYVPFEYDTKLELQVITSRFNGDRARASQWHNAVLSLRRDIQALNVPVFASPRFAYAAAKGFLAGLDYDTVIEAWLVRGINGDIKKLISPVINRYRRNY